MTDILSKVFTQRSALAQAILKVGSVSTMDAIAARAVPKGDVFEFGRAAGLLAVKKTSDVIPDCHPLPVEYCKISYETAELEIRILVEVATIYKTGVEVEAMHGAAVTALTMYDMLKPIDRNVEIASIRLLEKSGGKNDFFEPPSSSFAASIVVCSDTVHAGKKSDKAGLEVRSILEKYGVQKIHYKVIPDEREEISKCLHESITAGVNLLLFVGGTGLSPRDITPDVVSEFITQAVPGIMEAARSYGQNRTPYSMLSRGVAGFAGSTLLLTLPGSTRGARETMNALFPSLFHVFRIAAGAEHK